jgi:hypothetical protein
MSLPGQQAPGQCTIKINALMINEGKLGHVLYDVFCSIYNGRLMDSEIETELRKLEREEAKLILDVKKAAKENNSATAKVLAKNLVRLRQNKARMQESVAQLTGVNAGMKTQQVWRCIPQYMHCGVQALRLELWQLVVDIALG